MVKTSRQKSQPGEKYRVFCISPQSQNRPMLANTRQSWILDAIPWILGSGCWIPVFSSGTWILDFIPWWGSSILDSKALYSGFHKQNFPEIRMLLHGAKLKSNIFWTVHAYLIKHFEIYFSSNVRFYNVMTWSNFWSMQLFQTGQHFKLEEVWFWKGIFPSWQKT